MFPGDLLSLCLNTSDFWPDPQPIVYLIFYPCVYWTIYFKVAPVAKKLNAALLTLIVFVNFNYFIMQHLNP